MEDPRFTFFQKLAERIEDQMLSQMPAWNVPGETPEEGEWPARDAVPYVATSVATQDQDCAKVVRDAAYWRSSSDAGRLPGSREVEVTAEMQNVGGYAANDVCFRLFMAKWNSQDAEQIADAAYRAMAALAPVPLVSDGELAAVRERDMWRSIAETYENRIKELESYSHDLAVAHDKHTTEINTLRAELAQRPAPVPDTPRPDVVIREHRSDPRRLGLA